MGYVVETIPIDENNRLRVEAEDGPECPRGDWHMLTGFVHITERQRNDYLDVPAVYGDVFDLARAYEVIDEHRYRFTTDEERARTGWHFILKHKGWMGATEDFVVRFARAFHGAHIEWDDKYGGFWFVPLDPNIESGFVANWPDLEVGSAESLAKQAEVIKQEREIYRQWADGEVYGVIHEKRIERARVERDSDGLVRLPNPLTDDDIDDGWVEGESIWGCYLDDSYTAKDVAKETFDIPGMDES